MARAHVRSLPKFLESRYWSPEEAKQALAAAAESGLSLRAYAAEAHLDPRRLWRWRKRLESEPGETTPAFQEVRRAVVVERRGVVESERIEVVLRSGVILRIGASFDAGVLRRLLTVLEGEEGPC